MNYKKVYDNIINRAKDRNWNRLSAMEYVERHNIVPRSLGGKDTKDNLAFLTAREHFICHWLLYKLSEGSNKSKMANAWFRMCQTNEFQSRYNSKHYSRARKAFSDNNPFKSTDIIEKVKNRMIKNNPMKNSQISDKVRQALKGKFAGEKNPFYGRKHSQETINKVSGANHYTRQDNYIHPEVSLETRKKLSIAKKGKPNQSAGISNKNRAFLWQVKNPNGEVVLIKNLNEYAFQNNIPAHYLYRNRHGYKVEKLC
jgi:hypothetical protein